MPWVTFQLVTLKIFLAVPSPVAKQQTLQHSRSHDGQLPYFNYLFYLFLLLEQMLHQILFTLKNMCRPLKLMKEDHNFQPCRADEACTAPEMIPNPEKISKLTPKWSQPRNDPQRIREWGRNSRPWWRDTCSVDIVVRMRLVKATAQGGVRCIHLAIFRLFKWTIWGKPFWSKSSLPPQKTDFSSYSLFFLFLGLVRYLFPLSKRSWSYREASVVHHALSLQTQSQ